MLKPSSWVLTTQKMEAYLSWLLVWVWVWLALLATSGWWRRSTANQGLRLPPGPWRLPIIGSLHHLAGKLPHCALRDLAQRHGPVMLLQLGEVPTLVLSSPEAAREALKTQDPAFASRSLTVTMHVVTCGGRDIIFSPYGEYWRQLRKIAVTELLTMRRVASFRAIREEEVATMLHHAKRAAAAGEAMEIRARLSAVVSDTTFRAVMGDRCKQRDVFLRELDSLVGLTSGLNPVDLWPSSWLARFISRDLRRAQKSHAEVFRIIRDIVQDHLKGYGEQAEDLLDVLLKIHKDGGVDMVGVEAVIFDLFSAGSETSATTLEWAMAEMIKNPTVMKKATEEVRQAFQTDGKVVEDRISAELPYLQLVVRETLRLHPPLPLLLPREARQPCKVLGFDIPQGTQVIVNAWALGHDKHSWSDSADEFRPERFKDGGTGANFRGTDFEFIPFGAGRRMCPGMAFGLANVELPLASLLLHFDWEASDVSDLAEFDMTEGFGVTARRKANLVLRPSLRVPTPGPGVVV